MNEKISEKEIDEKVQKRVDAILTKRSKKKDIFSPEAQVPFSEYKGTREQYEREKQLRTIASGSKETGTSKTFGYVAAALFGDEDVADYVGSFFKEKFAKEEVESAKKTLKEEFGLEKKEKSNLSLIRKTIRIFRKELSPIKQSILGIGQTLNVIAKEVNQSKKTLNSLSNSLVGTLNQAVIGLAGGDLNRTPERMKPATVSDEEGTQYLYYPDAPPGRQLYEKSKTGTAGKIASKKIQRKLQNELKRISDEKDLSPVRLEPNTAGTNTGEIVSQIKQLLEEESMFRKRDMEKLLEDLQKSFRENLKNDFSNLEADEQEVMMAKAMKTALDKTLYDALTRVFTENPELLPNSGGGLLDIGMNRRGPKTPQTPNAPVGNAPAQPTGNVPTGNIPTETQPPKAPTTNQGFLEKIKNIGKGGLGRIGSLGRTGLGFLGGAAGTVIAATTGALAATAATFGAIDYGMKESANKAIQNLSKESPQDIAIALQAGTPEQKAYKLQELEKIAAESPEFKIKLDEAKAIAGLKPTAKAEVPSMTISPSSQAIGQKIVDENQKRIEIQSVEKVDIPAQSVTNVNNTQVIPIPSNKKTIEIHNNENTFNRLLAQDFNHPSTYTSMNMG